MTPEKRLQKALAKIEARKQRLQENGIAEPSKFGYAARAFIAPTFRGAVRLMYPKSGCVLLGDVNRKGIERLTKGQPVVYALAHRGVFDIARHIGYVLPHGYVISGDEIAFYGTINEYLFDLNGVLHFDRTDPKDSKLIVERASRILKSGHSVVLYPEGIPNVYKRGTWKK